MNFQLGVGGVFEAFHQDQVGGVQRAIKSAIAGSSAPRNSCISAQRWPDATITCWAPAMR